MSKCAPKTAKQKLSDYFTSHAKKVVSNAEMQALAATERKKQLTSEMLEFHEDVYVPAAVRSINLGVMEAAFKSIASKHDFDGDLGMYEDSLGGRYFAVFNLEAISGASEKMSKQILKHAPQGMEEKLAVVSLNVLKKLEDHAPDLKAGKLRRML